MRPSESLRLVACLLFGILVPPFLTQCKTSSGGSYKDVSYDPAKLKTPSGHGMERDDYPFDEQGNYRKDWVKSNAKGKDRSALPGPDTTPQLASTTTPAGETPAPTNTSYPTYAEAAARESGAYVGPATGAAPDPASTAMTLASAPAAEAAPAVLASAPVEAAAASYHKVTSGDTLFAIANRHSTSVADLKRINGLTGDSIRPGQSLRIP
jgi:LysM repeat protein